MTTATRDQANAVFAVLRHAIDATGWGGWVKDDVLRTASVSAANACEAARPKPATPPPAPQVSPPAPQPASPSSVSKGEVK